jgi:hypothetical protein
MDEKGNLTGGNKGTVKTNEAGGVIFNVTGGFVHIHQGTVYNCGGIVGSSNSDKGAGTEYFLVDIVYENAYALDSSGLTHEYGRDWIRQDGSGNSTAYIIITPTAGYEIKEISGIPGYVTAKSNSGGSWLLTIYSGASTSLNIAASQIQITVTPDQAPQGPAGVAEGGTTGETTGGTASGESQVQGNAVTLGPASNPAVTTPAIDTSATALATATWDGATIKIGETTVTVSALAAQDCAGLASTAVTQAELTVVYESIFASTIAANGGSVADARAEALRIATSLAEYITKDLPTNYTPAEAATYKAAYMDAFLKAIASGKTLKKARIAALSAARTKMAQALLDQLNKTHTEGVTIGIETSVAPAATQASVVGEAADPVAAQMIAQAQQAMQDAAQAQQAMQDASALANGQ